MDWADILAHVEDVMFPRLRLSTWERAVYYHLLRLSRVRGCDHVQLSMSDMAASLRLSKRRFSKAIRTLQEVGCIKVEGRPRAGRLVHVYLPAEMGLPKPLTEAPPGFPPIDTHLAGGYVARLLKMHNGQ